MSRNMNTVTIVEAPVNTLRPADKKISTAFYDVLTQLTLSRLQQRTRLARRPA